ncbi:isochorismate synthase [Halosimplex rubrum]|uniref:isochorismate synthase n=1 Tax=Halosimplex rubrum TaxID=869889 RepID=A0A7D5P642_9EURY|nr:isochorismate synthase [Halosimplex rubrum]QLH78705.1 isochorismate synthase [Halosimplex rubrum]
MEPLRGDESSVEPDETTIATRGREVDGVAVGTVLGELPRPTVAWSAEGRRVAAGGSVATIATDGPDRFDHVRRAGEALFAGRAVESDLPRAARPRLFGGFAFHAGDKDEGRSPWDGFPDAQFVLPAVQVVRTDDGSTWVVATATGPAAATEAEARLDEWVDRVETLDDTLPEDGPGIERRTFTPDDAGWRRQVEAAVERIRSGTLRKVVLAGALTVDLRDELSVPSVYERLSETYPDCFRFLVAPEDGGQFFGATPERLVSRDGRTVRTEALAGSTGRGDTPEEDEWLASELQGSEKDRHEHDLVVEAIKTQLDPYATSISTGDRTVRRLATVQHLQTPVTAELAEDDHVLSLVEALHPTPAVGGLPPDEALETIKETEAFDRGWYASPVGWFDAEGDGTFAVAIRSAVATERRATLFAGNGIVGDSDPDREWDEVQLKYRPVLDALE